MRFAYALALDALNLLTAPARAAAARIDARMCRWANDSHAPLNESDTTP